MHESHLRSVLKAFSWRICGTFVTMIIVFIITHRISFSIYIGLLEFVSKIVSFYLHERLWGIIPLGVNKFSNE